MGRASRRKQDQRTALGRRPGELGEPSLIVDSEHGFMLGKCGAEFSR
jgi:hypothetical protein